jgi:hypothetical protein
MDFDLFDSIFKVVETYKTKKGLIYAHYLPSKIKSFHVEIFLCEEYPSFSNLLVLNLRSPPTNNKGTMKNNNAMEVLLK